jgi:hypothetical protein
VLWSLWRHSNSLTLGKYGSIERVIIEGVQWEATKNGFIKINWDATVDKGRRKMGIGVVVRDGKGEVFVTLVAPKDYIVKTDIAEVAAALRAIC